MSKKKGNENEKRKQKTALKKARRRASQKPVQKKKKKAFITEEMFPEEDLLFWLAHGVNYILFDYDNGIWTPLFEEIYEGSKPTPEHIARTIVDKYGNSPKAWPQKAEAALAWSVQPRESVYMYFVEVLRRLGRKHDKNKAAQLACSPHNGIVWGVFKMIQDEMAQKKKQRAEKTKIPAGNPA